MRKNLEFGSHKKHVNMGVCDMHSKRVNSAVVYFTFGIISVMETSEGHCPSREMMIIVIESKR